jgi:hypothetical protein
MPSGTFHLATPADQEARHRPRGQGAFAWRLSRVDAIAAESTADASIPASTRLGFVKKLVQHLRYQF